MLGVTDYGTFVAAVLIFLLIPGPGNLALVLSTSKGGIRGGLAATLGVILGDQVLMWMAVAGVAALLSHYPTAFHLVQWAGAAYLAWLGAYMLFAKPGAPSRGPRTQRLCSGTFRLNFLKIYKIKKKNLWIMSRTERPACHSTFYFIYFFQTIFLIFLLRS